MARDACSRIVDTTRQLHRRNPTKYKAALTFSLADYGTALIYSGSSLEAREIYSEFVGLALDLAPSKREKNHVSSLDRCREFVLRFKSLRVAFKGPSPRPNFTRELHLLTPIQYMITLTAQLDILGQFFRKSRDYDKARAIGAECLKLRRDFQKINPAKYVAELATWRTKYGVAANKSVTSTMQETVSQSPLTRNFLDAERHAANLSNTLSWYGVSLGGSGLYERADEIHVEAVRWSLELHCLEPDGYADLLENSIRDCRELLNESYPGSCEVLSAVVDRYRHLHQLDAERYASGLAQRLSDYGYTLFMNEFKQKACDVDFESVKLTRSLHNLHPDQYSDILAKRLEMYGFSLGACGDPEYISAACRGYSDLVQTTRPLYGLDPKKYAGVLTEQLESYANFLGEIGRGAESVEHWDAGLEAYSESVKMTRELYHLNPDRYAHALAERLADWGHSLFSTQSYPAASEAYAESVKMTRQFHQLDPNHYTLVLAVRLSWYGTSLYTVESYIAASDPYSESVQMTRQLYHQSPSIHTGDLARRLHDYAASLHSVGSFQPACDACGESVKLTRQLYHTDPDEHSNTLANRLTNYGWSLRCIEAHEMGYNAFCEAVDLVKRHHLRCSEEFYPMLASGLSNCGESLKLIGSYKLAGDAYGKSAGLTYGLYRRDPGLYGAKLVERLGDCGRALQEVGSYSEASQRFLESVEIARRVSEVDPEGQNDLLARSIEAYDEFKARFGHLPECTGEFRGKFSSVHFVAFSYVSLVPFYLLVLTLCLLVVAEEAYVYPKPKRFAG